MKGEIDRDFYCSAGLTDDAQDCPLVADGVNCKHCTAYHRKWPTPQQFKEEYGVDYPDEGAVYIQLNERTGWLIDPYRMAKKGKYFFWKRYEEVAYIVCACTPWGVPPGNRRPK